MLKDIKTISRIILTLINRETAHDLTDFFVRYNGSEITLRDVQPKDEGEYACQLNRIDTPIELVHHLDVLSK